jgi:peptidoglycan/LPS O-acetylase OafA/YrhL
VTERKKTLHALTSLRFVAALLVFSWHCVPTRAVSVTFSFGYIGVAFFFLLSGFILTYTYHEAFRERLRPEAIRAFYVARIARVYPLHLATMPLMIACLVYCGSSPLWNDAEPQTRLQAVAAQAVLLQSWIPVGAIYFGANGPAWSISCEAFFYAVFPLAAFILLRAFRTAQPRTILLGAAALWLAQIAVLAPQHAAVDDWRWYVFPPARLVDFLVGMMVGIAFLRFGELEGARARARSFLRGTCDEVIVLALVVLIVYISPLVPLSTRFSAWCMPGGAAAIFVFARQRGAISRLLTHPALVRLGEVSFAFYLSHLAVLALLTYCIGSDAWFFMPTAFAGTLALSFALFHRVEQPLRTRVRALFAPRRRALPSVGYPVGVEA